ncbi:MAG: hypothetical protein KAX31_07055, partial [Thermoplasmata archaeon]|nr:hypothetical protein [Thermoplasmata archaeon]
MRTGYMLMFVLLVMCATALLVAEEGDAERALDVNLTLNEPSAVKVATLREQVQFNFTIEHNGSANSEEVVIDILNPYSLWNIFLSADPRSGTAIGTNSLDFTLDKDEAANLTVTLTFADSTLNGTYWFTVLAYPKLAPQNNDSYLIGVIVGQWVGFELVLWDPPPDDTYEAIPPSRALITYALYNTGNGDDRFLITGSSSRFDEGWTLTYILGIDDYGHTESLPPDPGRANPHFISISVDVPAGTLADQTSMVYLNCTSVF